MNPGYPPRDVVKLSGIPYSTLNLWAKNGIVTPSIYGGNGTGTERMYSVADVNDLRVAYFLKAAGLPVRIIRAALDKFRSYPKSRRIELLLSAEPEIYISIRRPE